jgi:AraC family transcriptional regulator, ethanolamine operon transcriptional activator
MVGVSERALLYGFKAKFRVSPSEYIKAYRLNVVKHEIYPMPNKPIFEIASKYHFWHMGQFAKDFKQQFGVLPSEVKRLE